MRSTIMLSYFDDGKRLTGYRVAPGILQTFRKSAQARGMDTLGENAMGKLLQA